MSAKKTKKLKLFEIGAKASHKISLTSPSIYICPICVRYFELEDLNNNKLTLEHVPPKSVGGKGIALTCSPCNNKSGHSIDVTIKNKETLLKLLSRDAKKIRGKLTIDGTIINVIITWVAGEVVIRAFREFNNPIVHEKLKKILDTAVRGKNWDGQKFKLDVTLPYNERLAKIGDLKSAFLVAFATFGYSFALHPSLECVRKQIKNPQDELMKNFALTNPNAAINDKFELVLLKNPLNCIFVQLNDRIIFLPWPYSTIDLYASLRKLFPNNKKTQPNWKGTGFPWPKSLEMRLDFNLPIS